MATKGRFFVRLDANPILGDWAERTVAGRDAGCTVSFKGTVRRHSRGKEVLRLEYEAYERMVAEELGRIATEIFEEYDVLRIAVEHATGTVTVGECSVSVAVASQHRAAAFAAATKLMDELKVRVPLWKKEIYPDGSAWIGRGS